MNMSSGLRELAEDEEESCRQAYTPAYTHEEQMVPRTVQITIERFTGTQVSIAIDTLTDWCPNEQSNLERHRDAIVRNIATGTEPEANSPLLLQAHAAYEVLSVFARSVDTSFTSCEKAIVVCLGDAAVFVFGLLRLPISNQKRIERALLRELGEDTLRGFRTAIENFNKAEGAYRKAEALFTLIAQIYNAGGFRAVIKIIKDEMSWWEWVKTSIIAIAQHIAWFATDEVAFVGQVALTIMSAMQLIEDFIKAVEICS